MEWVPVAVTATVGGFTLLGGFFGWLSKQFHTINTHLASQDTAVAVIKAKAEDIERRVERIENILDEKADK